MREISQRTFGGPGRDIMCRKIANQPQILVARVTPPQLSIHSGFVSVFIPASLPALDVPFNLSLKVVTIPDFVAEGGFAASAVMNKRRFWCQRLDAVIVPFSDKVWYGCECTFANSPLARYPRMCTCSHREIIGHINRQAI